MHTSPDSVDSVLGSGAGVAHTQAGSWRHGFIPGLACHRQRMESVAFPRRALPVSLVGVCLAGESADAVQLRSVCPRRCRCRPCGPSIRALWMASGVHPYHDWLPLSHGSSLAPHRHHVAPTCPLSPPPWIITTWTLPGSPKSLVKIKGTGELSNSVHAGRGSKGQAVIFKPP